MSESDPGDNRITINRSDLLRLADVLRVAGNRDELPSMRRAGWNGCVEAISHMADAMPDNCVLVDREDYLRLKEKELFQ
jgi:hypothetical protein